MPIPKPKKGESLKDFVARFMSNPVMIKEYPKEKQRYAIALQQWAERLEKMLVMKHLYRIQRLLKAKVDKYDRLAMKLANQMIGTWDKQTKEAIADLIRGIKRTGGYRKTGKLTKAEIKERLNDLSEKMGVDLVSKMRDPVNRFTEEIYIGEIKQIAGVGAAFDVVDERAVAWARKNTMYWIGEHYGDHLSEKMGKIAGTVLEEGMDRNAAALFLRKELGKTLKRSAPYWDLLANHVVTRSREFGRTSAYQKANVSYVRVSAIIDHRTSLICRELNGKIIPTSWNVEIRDKLINSKDPESAKKIAPWYSDKQVEQHITGKKVKDMPHNVGMPPYHARCRTRTVRATKEQWDKQSVNENKKK